MVERAAGAALLGVEGLNDILPVTGRWQAEDLTEGGFRTGFAWPQTPSTMLRMVPLPVPGRI